MYVYYLHFYFYLIPSLSQGITGLQNSYLLSLNPVYLATKFKISINTGGTLVHGLLAHSSPPKTVVVKTNMI